MHSKIDELLHYARGQWQRDVLAGLARPSGADLRGNAGRYRGRYMRSLDALMERLRSAGYEVELVKKHKPGARPRRAWKILIIDGEEIWP